MIRQCQWLHNLAGNDNDTVRIMKDWSRERCRGWQALTYRKFELHRVCPRIFPQIVFTLLQICARSWLTFVVVNLTAAGAKNLLHISDLDVWVDPVTSQRSLGVHMDGWRVKDERNIFIEYVQVRKSSRVGKLRLSNMHIPICLLLTGRSLARTLLCAANMPPRGLSNKVSDECICSPLWKFMRAFVVRYVNFTEHSYFCNFHAYYIRNWDIGFSIGHSRNCSNTIRFMLGCLPYVHMFVCQPFSLQCEDLIIQKFKA